MTEALFTAYFSMAHQHTWIEIDKSRFQEDAHPTTFILPQSNEKFQSGQQNSQGRVLFHTHRIDTDDRDLQTADE